MTRPTNRPTTLQDLLEKGQQPRALPASYETPSMPLEVYLEICNDSDQWATCRSWLTTVDPNHGWDAVHALELATPREARHFLHHLLYTAAPMRVITSALGRGYDAEQLLHEWCDYQTDAVSVNRVESEEATPICPGSSVGRATHS